MDLSFVDLSGLKVIVSALVDTREGGRQLDVAPNSSRAVLCLIESIGAACEQ